MKGGNYECSGISMRGLAFALETVWMGLYCTRTALVA